MKYDLTEHITALGYDKPTDGKILELPQGYKFDFENGSLMNEDFIALDFNEAINAILKLAEAPELKYKNLVTMDELKHFERQWIIPNILPEGLAGFVVAPAKSQKSYFALSLAVAVATGGTFAGEQCKQGNVLIFQNENDEADEFERSRQMNGGNIKNITYDFSREFKIEDIESYEDLIVARDIKLVIVDPMYMSLRGDGTDSIMQKEDYMRQVFQKVDNLRRKLKTVTFIFVHHTKKISPERRQRKDFEVSPEDIFGTMAINAWRQFLFLITPHGDWNEVSIEGRGYLPEFRLAMGISNGIFRINKFKEGQIY